VDFDQETLEFYAGEAEAYASHGSECASKQLQGFLKKLPKGAYILELGCGGGRDAEAMISQGFDVDATDGTPELARQAARRIGKPVRTMRFDQLEVREEYDAVWASACLLHVPRENLVDILRRIWGAMKPGAWHFASFKGGDRDGRDEFNRYFNYFSVSELKELYLVSGAWSEIEIESGRGVGYDGKQMPWHNVFVRKILR